MSEREKLIEVMAAAMRLGYAQSGSRYWDAVPERIKGAYRKEATAALAALEAAGVRLVYPGEAPAQLIDGDERTTVRIFTPYAPPGVGGE